MQLSVNGTDIFVATGASRSDRTLPAVVMIHGAGFDHRPGRCTADGSPITVIPCWRPISPGDGRSAGKALPRTISDMADWTAALLDAAKAPKAKLVGHSMGSLIALETAARHPAKVSGLSLSAPPPP